MVGGLQVPASSAGLARVGWYRVVLLAKSLLFELDIYACACNHLPQPQAVVC